MKTIDSTEIELNKKVLAFMIAEHRKFNPSSIGQPRETPAYPDTSLHEWLVSVGAKKGFYTYEGVRFVCTGMFGREPDEVGLYPFLEMVESCFDWYGLGSDDLGGGQHLKIRTGK